MTEADLAELERLEKAATSGEWEYLEDDGCFDHKDGGGIGWIQDHANVKTSQARGEPRRNADGHFIVALRNAFPILLATIRSLQSEVERLRVRDGEWLVAMPRCGYEEDHGLKQRCQRTAALYDRDNSFACDECLMGVMDASQYTDLPHAHLVRKAGR